MKMSAKYLDLYLLLIEYDKSTLIRMPTNNKELFDLLDINDSANVFGC